MENRAKTEKYTIWIITTLMSVIILLASCALIVIYIDPFFHYHAPLEGYSYPINNERYQNDGILKNFEYNAIITGTSMTENFMKTEADEVFDADFVKVPFSGGHYKEVNDSLKRAYASDNEIRYVIRCLDYSLLISDKDSYRKDINYPTYLYNDNLFDDVNYVWNKSILMSEIRNVFEYTMAGNATTSFDNYANWNQAFTFGAEMVLRSYTLGEKAESCRVLTEEERRTVLENIRQNVTDLADEHPETIFYLFFPPYSICYWDTLKNNGQVDWRIDAEVIAVEEILKHPNIKLYSFCDNFELVCNLDNYKDQAHYGEWVNSWILLWMKNDKYLLTEDTWQIYIKKIREFYNFYDYASLHK